MDPFKRYNCYKLLRHNFITGQSLLLKTPDTLNVVRRNLKELSDIVEKEDNLSINSQGNLTPALREHKSSESPKINIESEMAYNTKINSNKGSPRLKNLQLIKANTAQSVYDSDIANIRAEDKPKITIIQYEGGGDTEDADVDEGETMGMWRYSFKGPEAKKR